MGRYAKRGGEAAAELAADTLVSGIESVTDIGGGLVRIVYFVNCRSQVSGMLEKVLLPETHVMPACMVADAIGKAMLAIGRRILARPDGSLTVAH